MNYENIESYGHQTDTAYDVPFSGASVSRDFAFHRCIDVNDKWAYSNCMKIQTGNKLCGECGKPHN